MGRVRVHRVTYTENTAETVPYETGVSGRNRRKHGGNIPHGAGAGGAGRPCGRDLPPEMGRRIFQHRGGGYPCRRDDTGDLPENTRFRRRQPAAGPPRASRWKTTCPAATAKNVFHEGDRLFRRPRTAQAAWAVLRYFCVRPDAHSYGTKVYITSADGKFVYGWAIATDTGAFVQSKPACRWTCSTVPMPNPWQTA